jgi:hypothetical protein
MLSRIERLVTFHFVYNDVTNMMSVVVMTSDKGKCVGLALGKKYPTAASPLQTKKCKVHKI